jgi:hypothetical protein
VECVTVVHPSPTNVLSRQFLLRIDPSEKKAGTTLTFPRAAPAPARPDLTMTFDDIPENVAAVVFSHLGDDPRDRIRLAAVSKVWRSAEKSDASLPGTPRALCELGWKRITKRYSWRKATYWWSKAAATRDADVMYDLGCCYYNDFDGLLRDETKAYYNDFDLLRDETKAFELWERASGLGTLTPPTCSHTASGTARAWIKMKQRRSNCSSGRWNWVQYVPRAISGSSTNTASAAWR